MYTVINGEEIPLGEAFGYCYLPQIKSLNGEMISYSPLEDFSFNPYLDSQEQAEAWLRDRGLAGQVLRFAHHKSIEERGEDYSPWVTSGVVATISGKVIQIKEFGLGKYHVEAI